MRSTLYEADHEAFRASVRAFLETTVAPFHDAWEEAGIVPREVWTAAGAQGSSARRPTCPPPAAPA